METTTKTTKAPKRQKGGLPEDIREQLRAPLPGEAITKHPTKTFLSTIKAIYVVERLNDVFGVGGWHLSTQIEKETPDYVLASGYIRIPEFDIITPKQYGGHKTTGTNTELADGYKSAVTDVQSKCASYLEVGIDVFKGKVKMPFNGQIKPPEATKQVQKAKAPEKPKTPELPQNVIDDIQEKAKAVNNADELQILFESYPEYSKNKEYRDIFIELYQPFSEEKTN